MRPNELLGADFIGYDAPPAIVGKPGETISVPIFVSHFSDRSHPVKLRWWVSGYDSTGRYPHRGRAAGASRSPGGRTTSSIWSRSRSRCRTIRSSVRSS